MAQIQCRHRADTSSLWAIRKRPGRRLNYLQIQLGTHQNRTKDFQREETARQQYGEEEWQREGMHGSQLVLDKALGENKVGNEAGETEQRPDLRRSVY